jgi:hypothetical protein
MMRALAILVMLSNFQLRYDPPVLRRHEIRHLPRLTKQEIGTDIPIDLAPARDQIIFPENGRPEDPDSITFFPLHDTSVPNFAKAYPELARSPAALRRHKLEAADLGSVDTTHAFHTHVKPLKFSWGEGIAFLTQYTQESGLPNPATNQDLVYVFLGVTRTGSHFIRAQFAVHHDRLPIPHKELDSLPAASFHPPLDALEEVLASIEPAGVRK